MLATPNVLSVISTQLTVHNAHKLVPLKPSYLQLTSLVWLFVLMDSTTMQLTIHAMLVMRNAQSVQRILLSVNNVPQMALINPSYFQATSHVSHNVPMVSMKMSLTMSAINAMTNVLFAISTPLTAKNALLQVPTSPSSSLQTLLV